jgi:hypothetical protein
MRATQLRNAFGYDRPKEGIEGRDREEREETKLGELRHRMCYLPNEWPEACTKYKYNVRLSSYLRYGFMILSVS